MRIVVTSPSFGVYNKDTVKSMEKEGCTFIWVVPYDRDLLLDEIETADAFIAGVDKVDKEVIEQGRRLKVIAKHGIGVDNIDLKAAEQLGIPVTNSPGTNSDAVADLAFGLMISAARTIPQAHQLVKEGDWKRIDGTSVFGKTLGVIGLGKIGKGVAKRATGFDMNILGYDVAPSSPEEENLDIERVDLKKLYETADYITLHLPLLQSTKHLINKEALQKMKSNAVVINTARGGLIDESALAEALTSNQIRGAALDVFEKEPNVDPKLLSLDNLIVTPHMAAYTDEASRLTSDKTAENILNALQEKELTNVVNE
ncbi:phosphoglycerate dehydrogenase [Alteribacillus sp. YIM 98480]|uniref:phosphoglycerate dehydrogenase n=1 Tax=Alteribacillus sp. YIM 98480 TaxID=2606599 RepID=UPI00131B0B4A|nr:phosphoglycerate dehydrogenase [Alteribacillus sp. YIM 98480]